MITKVITFDNDFDWVIRKEYRNVVHRKVQRDTK